jgi:hypothetical protein
MAFAADHFRQFLNIEEAIDEDAFKRLIVRVRDELQKLASADLAIRRVVRAHSGQRTEDAVSQVLVPSGDT